MIDMHSHILFGVDDGAKNIDDSLKMIKVEIKNGVSHIILTPHFNKENSNISNETILENFKMLKLLASSEAPEVELYLGSEVYLDLNYDDIIWKGSFMTLADSDYMLIELSLVDMPRNIPEICYEVNLKGYIPILAHVERYENLYNNTKLISDILNEGAHFQVNSSAILNKEDKDAHKFINYLLKHELISFVASDMHNLDSRGSSLNEAYKHVMKLCGDKYADKIFKLNQQFIINNIKLNAPSLVLETKKDSIIKKILNKAK